MKTRHLPVLLASCLLAVTGCSSLGLTLWPSQLPILAKAKDFASRSPMTNDLEHELAKQPLAEYFVEPGDRLLIEPVEFDSNFQSAGDQTVLVDGSIDLGRYGRLRVSGMTIEAIEATVSDQIALISNKRELINVQLLEANAAQVYVLGAVGSPGAFNIDGHETVLDAILMAGGLTSKASPCDVILVRPTEPGACRVVQKICFRQITQLGDVTTNYQVEPGDRIVVGERSLGEELRFWKQSSACACCDRSRCVECRPENRDYRNRFVTWLPAFPIPLKADSRNAASAPAEAADINGEKPSDATLPSKSKASSGYRAGEKQLIDDDIFLPPQLPGDSPVPASSDSH